MLCNTQISQIMRSMQNVIYMWGGLVRRESIFWILMRKLMSGSPPPSVTELMKWAAYEGTQCPSTFTQMETLEFLWLHPVLFLIFCVCTCILNVCASNNNNKCEKLHCWLKVEMISTQLLPKENASLWSETSETSCPLLSFLPALTSVCAGAC